MNDNLPGLPFADHRALLESLVANLRPGPEGLASHSAIYRELERMRPGSLERAHARLQGSRLGLAALPDLSALDYAEA